MLSPFFLRLALGRAAIGCRPAVPCRSVIGAWHQYSTAASQLPFGHPRSDPGTSDGFMAFLAVGSALPPPTAGALPAAREGPAAPGARRRSASRAPVEPSWKPYRRSRSEEHTSELQSLAYLVCRLLLEKKKKKKRYNNQHK